MKYMGRWIWIVATLVLVTLAGAIAYNAGLASGFDQARLVAVPGAPAPPPYPYPMHHAHPWGSGHALAPFLILAFGLMLLRGLFRGGRRHIAGCGPEGRFEEWHRRMHDRMGDVPSTGADAPR